MRLLIAATVIGIGIAAARPAKACSPNIVDYCGIAPRAWETVPENVGEILYFSQYETISRRAAETIRITRVTDDVEIPLKVEEPNERSGGAWRLVPQTPLEPAAEYRIVYPDPCRVEERRQATSVEETFSVGPANPFPATSGNLVVGYRYQQTRTMRHWVPDGSCGYEKDHEAVARDVGLELDANAKRYLPVASFTMQVNGKTVRSSLPGEINEDELLKNPAWELVAGCDGDDVFQVKPGRHKVSIQMHLPGMSAPLSAAEADVELVCSARPPEDSGCRQVSGAPLVSLALLALLQLRRRG